MNTATEITAAETLQAVRITEKAIGTPESVIEALTVEEFEQWTQDERRRAIRIADKAVRIRS